MPLQNRVDPWGRLIYTSARGAWLGNRGILHNEKKEIVAPWRHKAWVTCMLEYKGIKREIFSPGQYSELFLLDEATALSAGHRPCAQCRRPRYREFKETWVKANMPTYAPAAVSIGQIDQQLHSERAIPGGGKVTHNAEFQSLPSGTFVEIDGNAYLLWEGRLRKWTPAGYIDSRQSPEPEASIKVLTPVSIVRMLAAGFTPQVHDAARAP